MRKDCWNGLVERVDERRFLVSSGLGFSSSVSSIRVYYNVLQFYRSGSSNRRPQSHSFIHDKKDSFAAAWNGTSSLSGHLET
jgi:hypothetical protein